MTDVKQALEQKAAAKKEQPMKLTKNMTIVDMVKALEPEIRRALPAVLTPERFTRMALSAINNTSRVGKLYAHELYRGVDERRSAGDGTQHTSGAGIPDPLQE